MNENRSIMLSEILTQSYSLEGEDRICLSILRDVIERFDKSNLFYCDIGCNDPKRINNTYLFHQMGYRGICIDPLDLEEEYSMMRGRDLFVNCAIGSISGKGLISVMDSSAASTLDKETKERFIKKFKVVETKEVKISRLKDVLDAAEATGYSIPLIDIDVEGMDYEVMSQALRLPYRPVVICVENRLAPLEVTYPVTQIDRLAHDSGYRLVAKTLLSSIYVDAKAAEVDWIPRELLETNKQ